MAGDTQRTSSQIAVHSENGSISGYDLRSWQGLTQVLQVARVSGMSSGAYAQFRDLILQYAQNGGDLALKKQIEAAIAAIPKKGESLSDIQKVVATSSVAAHEEKSPTAVPVSEPTSRANIEQNAALGHKRPSLGGGRPIPSFMPVHVGGSSQPSVDAVPVPEAVVSASPKEQMSPGAPQTPIEPVVPTPIPAVTEEPVIEAAPVMPITATKEPVAAIVDVPHIPQETPVKPVETPTTPEISSQIKPMEEYRARIAEIKREVNARVGNPVALIDAQNQIGRMYMTALLAAMKATGPGSVVRIEDAMASLEAAYSAVLSHQSSPQSRIVEVPAPKENVEDKQVIDVPIEERKENPPPATVVPEEVPQPPVPVAPQSVIPTVTPKVVRAPLPKIPSLLDLASDDDVSPVPSGYDVPLATADTQTPQQVKKEVAAVPARPTSPIAPAYEIPRQDVRVTEVPQYVAVMQTELASPEITESLNQLLHEWNIFKSSGVFGMGPGGIDHPLYVSLARLTMGEVITGRFERAEPDVIHTIKEYVDAWRHEQGVAYNPTETFEHYLRRVVQHILKRQKEEAAV